MPNATSDSQSHANVYKQDGFTLRLRLFLDVTSSCDSRQTEPEEFSQNSQISKIERLYLFTGLKTGNIRLSGDNGLVLSNLVSAELMVSFRRGGFDSKSLSLNSEESSAVSRMSDRLLLNIKSRLCGDFILKSCLKPALLF